MNKGSSQESRKNKALTPIYAAIDERSLIDMVHFTLEFSQNINFYNFQNKVTGKWKSFLLNDPAFIIAMIAGTNINKFKINDEGSEYQQSETHESDKIIQFTEEIYNDIKWWQELLTNANYKGGLLNEIENGLQTIDKKRALQKNPNPESIKDTYETIYGSMVFIKDQASKRFQEELKNSGHHPHIGLLLAFFKLFKNVQQDINSITKKHLDFYFLDLLKQQKKPPEPHTAIIALHLQPGKDNMDIPEGENFEMIYDGKQSFSFKTTSDIQINKAKIAEVKTLFKSDYYPFGEQIDIDENFSINQLYEANIITGELNNLSPEALEFEDYPATLGEEQHHHICAESLISQSEIGILITSPALILEKGKQNIQITFKITPASYNQSKILFDGLLYQEIEQQNKGTTDKDKLRNRIVSQFFSDAFLIYISNEEGWKKIEYCSTRINPETSSLDFNIQLVGQKDILVPFNNEIHEGEYKTEWPCIKFMLNNDAQYYPYKIIKDLVIEEINIEATVSEVTSVKLSNSSGNLDNSIPFMPFGPTPVVGNYLRIQNPLLFQKNLSHLEMNISWIGLPQLRNGFTNYYRAYPQVLDNSAFKAVITQSKNNLRNAGKQMQQEIELFEMDGEYLSNEKKITVKTDNFSFHPGKSGSKNEPADNSNPLFLVLTSPETGFGHQVFTEIYAAAAMKMSRFKKAKGLLPSQPYTPVIERLEVNYTNSAREIMLRKLDEKASDIKLVHLYPFGHIQVFPGSVKSQSFLLPQIEHKGHLLIGLTQISFGDVVSLGFELDSAVYVHTVIHAPEIHWEYLLNNEWEPLHRLLLEDTTDGLIRSGIVKIKIPKTIQTDNSRLPKGKFWLRAVYKGKEDVRSKIKNVFTQAVSLTSNDKTDITLPSIPDNDFIKKFTIEGRKNIAQMKGPYALKLNEPTEDDNMFYSQISEQLRHKNRAVSNWDVERIILDKFKRIEKVRAYGKSSFPNELVKGSSLQIVLIPRNKLADGSRVRSTKVDFSTLNEVKNYIQQFVSPHVKVEVSNPVYEQLKIRCSVKFNNYQKRGYYRNVLNNELISYLSPDIENEFIEKGFDESISKTEILNFIESRPYVDFVTEFSVLQLVEVQGKYKIIDTAKIQKINDLRTISAYAILTSAPEHQIHIIQDEKPEKSKISGIGDLSVEADFVISDGDGNYI